MMNAKKAFNEVVNKTDGKLTRKKEREKQTTIAQKQQQQNRRSNKALIF